MESMESHEAGFPPFPHSVEIPSGFPYSHGLDDWIYVFSCPLKSNHRPRKRLVTDVSGPQRNACPGTLSLPLGETSVVGYSRFGIAVDRKHEAKWLFPREKSPCRPSFGPHKFRNC